MRRKAPHGVTNLPRARGTARQDADAISHPRLRIRVVGPSIEWSRAPSQTGPLLSRAAPEMSDCDADTSLSRLSVPTRQ